MVESHGSVSEIREMARRVENNGVVDLIRSDLAEVIHGAEVVGLDKDEIDDLVFDIGIVNPFVNAILVEALNCLADKKEAERGR